MTLNPKASNRQKNIALEETHTQSVMLTFCKKLPAIFGLGLLSFLLIFFLPNTTNAQTPLNTNGNTQTVDYNGSFRDFTIPNDPSISQIQFTAKGGDGGFATLNSDDDCKGRGGGGATLNATFNVGTGGIPYGSTVRFIVGERGTSVNAGTILGVGEAWAGGGGGTGILYRAPGSSDWNILSVAGGGGGGYTASVTIIGCSPVDAGNASSSTSGGRGGGAFTASGPGGENGNGGGGTEFSGAGGGAFSNGGGPTCVAIPSGNTVSIGGGKAGGNTGGAGGRNENGCTTFTFFDGGFGFGGGGAGGASGGGGGGYSGGGAGGDFASGGGGGSFLNSIRVSGSISSGSNTGSPSNGNATYKVIRVPIANCVSGTVTLQLDENGFVTVRPADINNGSTGPDGFTVSVSPGSFTCANLGRNTVTLTVTDPATGNTDQCTTTVDVVDNTHPSLTCPGNITVANDLGSCGASVDFTNQISADDNCSFTLSYSKNPGSFFDVGTTPVIITATDPSGNSTSCTFDVTVEDREDPVLVCPTSVVQVNDTGNCGAIVDFSDLVSTIDNCNATLSFSQDPGTFFPVGDTEVTVTSTDAAGNTVNCSFIVTIFDTEAPKTLPFAPTQLSCDASTEPSNTGIPIATDNCDDSPMISYADEIVPGPCADDYTILRTWTISDVAGNSTSFVHEITILPDQIAPVCLNCPIDVTVSCESIPEIPSILASDNCDPSVRIDIKEVTTQVFDGSCGEFNYSIARTFTLTDRCGNVTIREQVITVVDETAPVITCPADFTVDCRYIYELDVTGMATATDNCDDSPVITYADEVVAGDCEWECTVERTWTATDACGNSSSCVQTILRTSVGLVAEAMASGPIELGRDLPYISDDSDNFLSIGAESAQCIVDWLPGTGDQPNVIPGGHYIVEPTKCEPFGNMLDADGKITNPLLAEMLTLAVNWRLNPETGDTPLSDLPCDIPPIINQYMRGTPTIAKMYEVANNSLGNVYGLKHQDFFLQVLECINGTFDKCAPVDNNPQSKTAPQIPLVSNQVIIETGVMSVYPNPTAYELNVDLSSFAGKSATIRIYTTQGQVIREQQLDELPIETIRFQLNDQPSGLYFIKAFVDGHNVQSAKIMLKR